MKILKTFCLCVSPNDCPTRWPRSDNDHLSPLRNFAAFQKRISTKKLLHILGDEQSILVNLCNEYILQVFVTHNNNLRTLQDNIARFFLLWYRQMAVPNLCNILSQCVVRWPALSDDLTYSEESQISQVI
jgi:hypothetical protein